VSNQKNIFVEGGAGSPLPADRPCVDGAQALARPVLAFTLIEVMVVVALLSLIVIALMSVFSSTQRAFRASVTQSDVLEGGRATMDLMAGDFRQMAPSGGTNEVIASIPYGPVNFYLGVANAVNPLIQPLTASISGTPLTNVLEDVFILTRENRTWTGIGYVVDITATNAINPLYRFSMSTNVAAASPQSLYAAFYDAVKASNFSGMSHLVDGVMTFRVRAYDPNGIWLTNGYSGPQPRTVKSTLFYPPLLGEVGMTMGSNTVPASVQVELATLEDRTLQHAEAIGIPGQPPSPTANAVQWNYLQSQAGKVHVFRQRVTVPNVDPTAYQP
jgi:type II secretory pathway pseudopilin PulG